VSKLGHLLTLIVLSSLLLFGCASASSVPKRQYDWRYMTPGEGPYIQYFNEEYKQWIQMRGF
jgi:hypothetical protein